MASSTVNLPTGLTPGQQKAFLQGVKSGSTTYPSGLTAAQKVAYAQALLDEQPPSGSLAQSILSAVNNNPIQQAAKTAANTTLGAAGAAISVGKFLGEITDPKHIVRLLLIIMGLIALLVGIAHLLKSSTPRVTPVPIPV